ncbi:MAG: peptidoglycan DD-metalloendopeptidase family protein [Nitrospinae bacterium]|nr:peptidoglycan DD-metalloendopeptidase family protein [Nitrospinota bacterium]
MSGYTAKLSGSAVYDTQFTRDTLGRITRKVETVAGVATTYDYAYDSAGRLVSVSKNGAPVSSYSYDSNSNRITGTQGGIVTQGYYDLQDRLTTYGNNSYTYTPNGELLAKTANGQTTTYNYDVMGNLLGVTMPDGTLIEYVMDGQNRRVGTKVNGVLTQAWLYQDGLKPIAELDGAGNLATQFVYGAKINVPEYILKGGLTYRIISDHLGSPRRVVDTATGTIAQRMEYDEWGNVTLDTNPGFQPFGFAGGLLDQNTKLVRFGVRDYDSETGRWTSKDKLLFYSDNINLYGYTFNDPVNFIDPLGLTSWPVDSGNVTSEYGVPRNPNPPHNGIDIENPINSPVRSSDDGTVIRIKYDSNGGNQIIIRNSDGSESGYAHTAPTVAPDDKVTEGQEIGNSDGSGAGNPHLHYTWRPCPGCPREDPRHHLPFDPSDVPEMPFDNGQNSGMKCDLKK